MFWFKIVIFLFVINLIITVLDCYLTYKKEQLIIEIEQSINEESNDFLMLFILYILIF